MNQASFIRAAEIQEQLAIIREVRGRWEQTRYLQVLAELVGRTVEYAVRPKEVLTQPQVAGFRQTVFDRLTLEEAALRREFDSL